MYVDKVHEFDPATPDTAHLYGSAEPRICTPPLRELTPDTSLGFDVIDFAYEVLGIILHPWQRAALIRMLELLEDGTLRFETVVILVARQNGKSTLAQVLTIYVLVAWGWPLVLGTAQDLDVAEQLWQEVVDLIEDDEELSELISKVVKVNGKKELKLSTETADVSYKVKAANRRAGRGLSGNLILLDELREHQNWDAYGAITKTTMARGGASLIVALSNAGDALSRVLRYLRLIAHKTLGDPDGIVAASDGAVDGPTEFDLDMLQHGGEDDDPNDVDDFDVDGLDDLELEDLEQEADSLCLLEWSAAPGCDRRDRTGWSWANPSRRYQITDRKIVASLKDPEWVFRTEVLCQWNDGATNGPFAPGSWEMTTTPTKLDDNGRRTLARPKVDRIVGQVYAGLSQTNNRGTTYIALAGWRPDGLPQVELVLGTPNAERAVEWLQDPDRKGRIRAVGGQTSGAPEATQLRRMQEDRKFKMKVRDVVRGDLIDAFADADEMIREQRVWHTPWPVLDLAAQTAEWKVLGGGQRVIDSLHSPIDPAALRAWIVALWMLLHPTPDAPPPPPPPRVIKASDEGGTRSASSGVNFAKVAF